MIDDKQAHSVPCLNESCIYVRNEVENYPSDAKLIWNCRRGMLELDLMLTRFVEQRLSLLSLDERLLFERLLSYPDPMLYALLMGQIDLEEDEEMMHFVRNIRTQHPL